MICFEYKKICEQFPFMQGCVISKCITRPNFIMFLPGPKHFKAKRLPKISQQPVSRPFLHSFLIIIITATTMPNISAVTLFLVEFLDWFNKWHIHHLPPLTFCFPWLHIFISYTYFYFCKINKITLEKKYKIKNYFKLIRKSFKIWILKQGEASQNSAVV